MTITAPPPMSVVLLGWRPWTRNTLRGHASVMLGRSLQINGITIHQSNGRSWAALPGKPVLRGGQPVLDGNGKPRYVPVLEWADRQSADRFSAAVVAAIIDAHGPEALEATSA